MPRIGKTTVTTMTEPIGLEEAQRLARLAKAGYNSIAGL